MIHEKLEGLMTPVEKIARVANAGLVAATTPQTSPSGAISLDNADGTRTIIGEVSNGEDNPSYTMATHVGDTTPPGIPTGITATSRSGVVVVEWDGTLTDGIPDDFFCVRIFLDGTELGALTEAGSVASAKLQSGTTHQITATSEDDCCLPDGTPSHNVSDATQAISVTVAKDASEVMADIDEQIEGVEQEIADFKANTYTKAQTDKKVQDLDDEISTELTTNYYNKNQIDTTYATKTFVSQTKEEIELSASQTYATKGIGSPNLSPFFAHDFADVWDETSNPDGYWYNFATTRYVEQLDDGWARASYNNTSSATQWANFYPMRREWVKPGGTYTFLLEWRNNTLGNKVGCTPSSSNVSQLVLSDEQEAARLEGESGERRWTFHAQEDALDAARYMLLRVYTYAVAGSASAPTSGTVELRASLYEGEYDGPFKPYVTDQQALGKTYSTKAELTVGLDGIRQEVASEYQSIDAMGAYSTTAEMQSAIQTSATGIEQSVAATYSTKQATADAIAAIQVGGRNLITLEDTYRGSVNPSGTDGGSDTNYFQRRSGYIPATAGETYQMQVWGTPKDGYALWCCIAFYDSSKALVGTRTASYSDVGATHHGISAVAPSGTAYMRVAWTAGDNGHAKLEVGTLPTDYTAAPEDLLPRPNLTPWGTHDPSDAYNATSNPDGYWLTDWSASTIITELDDGWIHFERSNASGTGNLDYTYPRARPVPGLEPGEIVTLVVEFRNVTYTGNAHVYVQQLANAQLWGGNPQTCNVVNNSTMYLSDATTRRMVYVVDSDHKTGDYAEVVRLNHRLPAGASASYDFRVSLYRGGYEGGYVPYSIEDATLSKTYTKSSTFTQTVDGLDGRITTTEDGLAVQQTLIRQYAGGVLVAYTGNSVGALVNAAGQYDIVSLTWSDGEPTVGQTLASFSQAFVSLMGGGASLQHTAEGGATIRSAENRLALVGSVKTSDGTIYDGFAVNPKGTSGHFAAVYGDTLRVSNTYPDEDPSSSMLYTDQRDYPMHLFQGMLDLITPAGGRAYGSAFDPALHKMKIACGSNVGTAVTQTITHNMGFAGVAAVIVSGGDDVGLSGSQLVVADSVGANSFEAKKVGGSTGNWRVNWVAIGWITALG